jgi:hypothetical protein
MTADELRGMAALAAGGFAVFGVPAAWGGATGHQGQRGEGDDSKEDLCHSPIFGHSAADR